MHWLVMLAMTSIYSAITHIPCQELRATAKEELSGCDWVWQTERNDQESWEDSTERDEVSDRAGTWETGGKEEDMRADEVGSKDPGAELRKWYHRESTSQTRTEEV